MNLQDETVKQAFEVEDISTRKNYSFLYLPDKNEVHMVNTSRGYEKYKIECIFPDSTTKESSEKFPFDCKTAYEYFCFMYRKSLNGNKVYPIYFLGWVDTENFEPIESHIGD